MIALSVSDVNLSFGTDIILKDISFAINDGDRLGVIGVNGAGKTSLFKIITGEYAPDSGAVYIQKGHTVGVLAQNADLSSLPGEMTCIEYMYTAYSSLLALEKEITKTEQALASATSTEETMNLTARLNEQNARFASLGGLEFRSRCRGMLLRLGFDDELINRHVPCRADSTQDLPWQGCLQPSRIYLCLTSRQTILTLTRLPGLRALSRDIKRPC